MTRPGFLVSSFIVFLATAPAHGYATRIHELMPLRALAKIPALSEPLPAVSKDELTEFRMFLDSCFRAVRDRALVARYTARWPTPDKFTARELKRLLGLNMTKELHGIDLAGGLPCTALQALGAGSAQPDTDWRNRERLAVDQDGKVRTLPDGRELPPDPLVLNMGKVRGLSSQAHAHYGLADVTLSADADVLKNDPRRFALPSGWPKGPVKTFARESSQLHFDLAMLAIHWPRPAGRSLGYLFLGQGMHYLEDVGNQIHTVQVGDYDLLKRARLIHARRAVLTLGGYAGELKPWTHVGIDLITTHHVVSECLNAKRIDEAVAGKPVPPLVTAALEGLGQDDPELAKDIDAALAKLTWTKEVPRKPYAATITGCLIERSSHEGADVYRHMAGAMHPRMSTYGTIIDTEDHDPDSVLADTSDPAVKAHLDALYGLHARAYKRVGTALRRVCEQFQQSAEALRHVKPSADPAFAVVDEAIEQAIRAYATALLRERLDALDGEEQRLAEYIKDPPAVGAKTEQDARWALVPLTPALLLAVAVLAARRRKQPAR